MSLQVSNQTTSGRRTPQVYSGFGSVPAGATTTPTATNGSGTTKAKGGNKQSQIPVAIGSGGFGTPGSNDSASVPQQVTVVHATGATDGMSGQKQQVQSDHMYGMKQQQQQQPTVPTPNAANRSATNGGSQPSTNVEKNGTSSQRKNSTGEKKQEVAAAVPQQQAPVPAEPKVRDSSRSSARAQQKQTVEEAAAATPAKTTEPQQQQQQQQSKPEKTAPALESSLMAEKSLKGFTSDGEEMPSLLLDPWDLDEPSTPARSSAGKSKGQKAAPQQPAATAETEQKGSPTKKATTTEEEGEAGKNRSPKVEAPSTPVAGGESVIGRPLRSISGRRSMRPISEIKFTHPRRSTDQHNDSISSMNVTVGSEIGNDSLLRTPGSATRKRKDMTPESTSDEPPVVDSPKRARLEALYSFVSTPVTMLKNRLSRVKLQSTPRSLAVDEEDASKVVTAEATTTTTSVTPQKDDAAMEVDVAGKEGDGKSDDTTGKNTESAPADGQKAGGAAEGQQESASSVAEDDEVEVKIVTDQPQQPKQWCSIM